MADPAHDVHEEPLYDDKDDKDDKEALLVDDKVETSAEDLQHEESKEELTQEVLQEGTHEDIDHQEDVDVQQPIPFQMGVTPTGEEPDKIDELQTWYEGGEESSSLEARSSTDPSPKAKS